MRQISTVRGDDETHASTTDPEARLYRKGPGKEGTLCFMGYAVMENQNGLGDACLMPADGHAERIAALHMIEQRADRPQAITLAADKACDVEGFINELQSMKVTAHMAQNTSGRSLAVDRLRRDTRLRSQRVRKRTKVPSAGSRQSPGRRKPSSEGGSASGGPSPSLLRLTI
jgi:hypothetical protein